MKQTWLLLGRILMRHFAKSRILLQSLWNFRAILVDHDVVSEIFTMHRCVMNWRGYVALLSFIADGSTVRWLHHLAAIRIPCLGQIDSKLWVLVIQVESRWLIDIRVNNAAIAMGYHGSVVTRRLKLILSYHTIASGGAERTCFATRRRRHVNQLLRM